MLRKTLDLNPLAQRRATSKRLRRPPATWKFTDGIPSSPASKENIQKSRRNNYEREAGQRGPREEESSKRRKVGDQGLGPPPMPQTRLEPPVEENRTQQVKEASQELLAKGGSRSGKGLTLGNSETGNPGSPRRVAADFFEKQAEPTETVSGDEEEVSNLEPKQMQGTTTSGVHETSLPPNHNTTARDIQVQKGGETEDRMKPVKCKSPYILPKRQEEWDKLDAEWREALEAL
eukprot:Lithocolla_globosa_v1_NODE_7268_length_970_cov_2.419672.p1 type:complete len:233 gc:universal NODE_7268_length_970_cov_2.419672:747-49(-)